MKKLVAILACCCATAAPAQEPAEAGVWQADAIYSFSEAYETARQLPPGREARYALAVTMLNLPTKTQSNIDAATALLAKLAEEDGGDETGIAARYFLGRIAQLHRLDGPDFSGARAVYLALYQDHPKHSLAQLGYIHAVLMDLYDPASTEPPAARFSRVEQAQPRFDDPQMRRIYHQAMGQACLYLNLSKAHALEHYLLSDDGGKPRQGNLYVVIGELARELGRREVAAQYYEKFLRDFSRDERAYRVRQLLAALPATEGRP